MQYFFKKKKSIYIVFEYSKSSFIYLIELFFNKVLKKKREKEIFFIKNLLYLMYVYNFIL